MGSAWRDGRRKRGLFYALSNISAARPDLSRESIWPYVSLKKGGVRRCWPPR
jgi:hypothetical protein